MFREIMKFTRRYWRWFPLWGVLVLAALSVMASLPFSDYYLYPLSQFTGDLWAFGFDLLRHPETLLLLAILFAVMLFTAPEGAPSRGIALGYISMVFLFGCIFTLLSPVTTLFSDNQPPRIEAEGPNHDYLLYRYISGSDGTFYTLHVCDAERILCRHAARVRSDTYYSIFVEEPQVDVVLNITATGIEILEAGDVIYSYRN